MIKVVAKYHVLIFASFLLFVSCQVNQSFKHQKYTRLYLRETRTENALLYDSVQSFDLAYQSVQFSSPTESKSTIDYSENFVNDTTVKMKDQIVPEIKNAIARNTPIVVVCETGTFLVKEPYYDSIANFLCGVYTKEFKLQTGNNAYLQLDYSEYHCSDINQNCIQVKKIQSFSKPVAINSTGIAMVNTEQAIEESIELGVRIYLITPNGVYVVHEPKLDTLKNTLHGRFVKIENERITPNLCLNFDKKAEKQIDSGYVRLSTAKEMEDSTLQPIEVKTEKEIRREERSGALAILFLILGVLHVLFGVSFGQEIKNKLLRDLVYMLFFIPAAILLALCLACLIIVLD